MSREWVDPPSWVQRPKSIRHLPGGSADKSKAGCLSAVATVVAVLSVPAALVLAYWWRG